ncbi:stage III sporulation protein AF [Clostridium formicaceticum]|nr:stage III sporulation protein AF [Clostridium formicaceticum]ARE87569.1 Stage III sporulation protein AF (Spore_III_AF) [Clostridium formicaceticum]
MIREWIITIVSVIIFVTFVEILIPNSNNKRFINVVVGLLIMMVILNPLMGFLQGEVDLGEKILQTSNHLDYKTAQNRIAQTDYMQEEAVVALYKGQLAQQMKNRIENNFYYTVEDIHLEIEEKQTSEFGMIHGVEIILREGIEDTNRRNEKKEIVPIKIDVALNKSNNTVEAQSIWINNEEESMIKNDFSVYYNLPKDNINIYIRKDK